MKTIRNLIISLLAFTPLILSVYTEDTFNLPKLVFFFIVTLFILARYVDWQLRSENNVVKIFYSPIDAPFLIFIFVNLISLFTSINTVSGIMGMRTFFDYGFITICFGYLLYSVTIQYFGNLSNIENSTKELEKIVFGLGISSAVVIIYGLLQYYSLEVIKEMPICGDSGRIWSSFGNPIYLGTFCTIGLLVLVGQIFGIWDEKDKIKKIVFYSILVSLYIPILSISQTRSSFLSLGFGLLVFGFGYLKREMKQHYKKIGSILMILLCLAAGIAFLYTPIRQKITNFRPTSDLNRFEGWKSGIKVFLSHPILGTGPDTFRFAFRQYKSLAYVRQDPILTQGHAHGDWIQFLATTGIIGFLAYLYLWGNIFLLGFKFFVKPEQSRKEYYFQLGIFSAIVSIFAGAQFNALSTTIQVVFWILLAMFSSQFKKYHSIVIGKPVSKKEQKKVKSLSNNWWLYLIAFVLSSIVFYEYYLPELYFSNGKKYLGKANWYDAYVSTSRAIKIDPYQNRYYVQVLEACRNQAKMVPVDKRKIILKKALDYTLISVRLDGTNPDAWQNLGVVYMWLTLMAGEDNYEKAIQALHKAIELDPFFVDAHFNLAGVYHYQGNLDEEKKLLMKVLYLDPKNIKAREILGPLAPE